MQFEKDLVLGAVPLMGQQLWLRATDQLIQIYREQERVATHADLVTSALDRARSLATRRIGLGHGRSAALPARGERIGPHCHALIQRLFANRVLDHLRAAQGVIRLEKQRGSARLEAACERALAFDDPRYRTVKTILAKGLDQTSASNG
ncbi:MAG: hypothetical protein IPH50_08955 [Rhodanobacteraceae bacterium]|nr:hypothetical protein [Rhodanobacteraceae bacterium]